jgi:hypothetical protein
MNAFFHYYWKLQQSKLISLPCLLKSALKLNIDQIKMNKNDLKLRDWHEISAPADNFFFGWNPGLFLYN